MLLRSIMEEAQARYTTLAQVSIKSNKGLKGETCWGMVVISLLATVGGVRG